MVTKATETRASRRDVNCRKICHSQSVSETEEFYTASVINTWQKWDNDANNWYLITDTCCFHSVKKLYPLSEKVQKMKPPMYMGDKLELSPVNYVKKENVMDRWDHPSLHCISQFSITVSTAYNLHLSILHYIVHCFQTLHLSILHYFVHCFHTLHLSILHYFVHCFNTLHLSILRYFVYSFHTLHL